MLASRTRTVLRAGRRAGVVASALILLALGVSWSRSAEIPPDPAPRRTQALAVDHGPIVHSGSAQLDEALDAHRLFSAVLAWNAATTTTTTTLPPSPPRDPFVPTYAGNPAGQVNGYPCGGDLPPCHVLARESGGNPLADNPISTACGLWQFLTGTWNSFGGYPTACHAPPEVQNEKARLVWDGGNGCSHWSEC